MSDTGQPEQLPAESESAAMIQRVRDGPQIDPAAPEDTAVDEETQRVFADAFGPDDDGGFAPEEFEALAAEYEDSADDNTDDTDDTEIPSGNAEAARYRHRLRDAKNELAATQDQLDALQQRVDVMHRASAEAIAAGVLIEPA